MTAPAFSKLLQRWRGADPAADSRGKFTQEEAAKKLGVPFRTYQEWEQGRMAPNQTLRNFIARMIRPAGVKRKPRG